MCSIILVIALALLGTMIELFQYIIMVLVVFLVIAVIASIYKSVRSVHRNRIAQESAEKAQAERDSSPTRGLYEKRDELDRDIDRYERDVEFYRMALTDYPDLDYEGRRQFAQDLANAERHLEHAREERDDVGIQIHNAERDAGPTDGAYSG